MILLFIIVFIKKALKNKASDEQTPNGGPVVEPEKAPVRLERSAFKKKLTPWPGRFPDIGAIPPGRLTGEAAEPEKPPPPPKSESVRTSPTAESSLHVLKNGGTTSAENTRSEEASSSDYYNRSTESDGSPPAGRGRGGINRLPELKKAVIWAEILGKPKGLE